MSVHYCNTKMTLKIIIICLSTLFLIKCGKCANILGIFPASSPSHFIIGNSLMKSLAKKGHNVTMVSAFSNQNKTYRNVTLTKSLEKRRRKVNFFKMGEVSIFQILPVFARMITEITEETLEHKNVQELLNSKTNFDVVIILQGFNDALKGFASHFNASLVLISSVKAHPWVNVLSGNPAPTSYASHPLLPYYTKLSFWERTINTLTVMYDHVLHHVFAFPKQKQIYDKYFPKGPPFYKLLHSTSIYFINYHPVMNQPVPYLPTMVDIGGSHLQSTKKLPQNLETFLNESQEGIIYFNLGSKIKSSEMPPKIRDAFIKTFEKLELKVLWKWEDDTLPGQPKNVKIEKWIPQLEVLAHPNVKLFISHCGILSLTEAIRYGVPILGIPVFADQKMNAKGVKSEGFGTFVDFNTISEEVLTDKIVQLLEDPKYSTIAKMKSNIFKDNQMRPSDTFIFWIEYLVRHKNAPHLRAPDANFSWCQYMLMDVLGVVLVMFLTFIYTLLLIIKKFKNMK